MEIKEKILEKAIEMFWKYGVRSVTMNDIAKDLGMSKKTLYQYFDDKTSLVKETVNHKHNHSLCQVEALSEDSTDAIDSMTKITRYFLNILQEVNPAFFYDIQKYYPEIWNLHKEREDKFILEHIRQNLERGIQNGLYRKDINIEILAHLVMAENTIALDENFFPSEKFSLVDLHSQMIEHFIRGIVTLKGFQKLEEYTQHKQQIN